MNTLLDRVKGVRFIEVQGKEYDLFDEISLKGDLRKIFMEHTEKALFWNRLLAKERAALRKLEDEYKAFEASMFKDYWHSHEIKHRQFSDGLIWSFVHQDDEVIRKKKGVRLSRKKVEALKVVCEAFEHRKTSIMMLGSLFRREEEEISVKKRR